MDPLDRRTRALARLESTGDVNAVARAFDIEPGELRRWAAGATGGSPAECDESAELLSHQRASERPTLSVRLARGLSSTAAIAAFVLAAMPLLAWPAGALWLVVGGFIDHDVAAGKAVFGWSFLLYPATYILCVIGWFSKHRRDVRAIGFALVPWLQIAVCVLAFAFAAR